MAFEQTRLGAMAIQVQHPKTCTTKNPYGLSDLTYHPKHSFVAFDDHLHTANPPSLTYTVFTHSLPSFVSGAHSGLSDGTRARAVRIVQYSTRLSWPQIVAES